MSNVQIWIAVFQLVSEGWEWGVKPAPQIPLPYYKTRHVASGLNGSFRTLDLSLSGHGSMELLVHSVINLLVPQEAENSSTSRAFRSFWKRALPNSVSFFGIISPYKGMGDQISKDTEKCSIDLTTKCTEINSKFLFIFSSFVSLCACFFFEPLSYFSLGFVTSKAPTCDTDTIRPGK